MLFSVMIWKCLSLLYSYPPLLPSHRPYLQHPHRYTLGGTETSSYQPPKRDWKHIFSVQFSSVAQSLSRVHLFATLWTTAHQAYLSITKSWSLLKLMSIKSMMPSNHLILCRALLFPPSIFSSIRVFSNDLVLRIRWPKY